MSDGLALVIATVVAVLFWWLLYIILRAERFARYMARWIHSGNRIFSLRLDRIAKGLTLAVAGCAWLITGMAALALWFLAVPQGPGDSRGWFFVVIAVWLAVVAVLAVGSVVVAFTGRPAVFVIKPCRGKSPDEINRWVRETADLPDGWQ